MKELNYKGIKIEVYTDICEWGKEFYDVPDGAVVDDDCINECYGFANSEDKEIYFYVPKDHQKIDLYRTVAHELGHIIEFKHFKNPDPIPIDVSEEEEETHLKQHEEKAEFFESFFVDVLLISEMVSVACCFVGKEKELDAEINKIVNDNFWDII